MTDEVGRDAARPRGTRRAPKNWQEVFIARLSETSHVGAAADEAGVSAGRAYRARREDAGFARRWLNALREGYDNLEMDLLYRLRSGRIEEIDEDGNKRRFDLATGFRCLQAHREALAKEQTTDPVEDERSVYASINAKIDAMRARERAMTAMLQGGALPTSGQKGRDERD